MNSGLPTRKAHSQARIALRSWNIFQRLLNHAHQNRNVEHCQRDGAGNDGILPAKVHAKDQKAKHANND